MTLHTLAAPATHAVEVKHSRFVANAVAVEDAGAAMRALAAVSVADATHNCWAWRIGGEYRSSDDGEPAGTAGRPILAAIDGQGIDRALVVVTRWFGGTRLGAGGLVRAYGGTAAECLRRAQRVPLVEMAQLALHAPFDALGSVHVALAAAGAEKLDEAFDSDGARLRLRLPASGLQALKLRLRDATRNRVRIDDEG